MRWHGYAWRSRGLTKTIRQKTVHRGRKSKTEEKMGWKYQWVDRPHIRQVPESVCKSKGMKEAGWSLQRRTDGLQGSGAADKGKKIAACFVWRSRGLAKTSRRETVQRCRKRERQKKRWDEKFSEWTDLTFVKCLKVSVNREGWRKLVDLFRGAPTASRTPGQLKKVRRLLLVLMSMSVFLLIFPLGAICLHVYRQQSFTSSQGVTVMWSCSVNSLKREYFRSWQKATSTV